MDMTATVAFYADVAVIALPWADSSLALRYIAKRDPDYIVLSGYGSRPYLVDWLRHGIPDPRAKLVYRSGTTANSELMIYRWKK